ncbi:APH(3') family aminoglycoside O-phosphotransferase [Proteiniborus sp. MB09-C3]|uniref:APH(3') family aminoglycoside O-phosphotransferase n=1 Tax=Proteiniborus sp. MB09-C3 TaxID=3050072 RepID=UPI002553156D|nr:APH(3') family aminoglycoside O-phosphotransferase [Proteiniborus sp. MB09-C3]WIV12692.1 aminoglycoside 3'-phosphotransferase [Proteiniborus sp. MB09-C3]
MSFLNNFYPQDLGKLLAGMNCEKNHVGCSTAGVYRYYNERISYYLKIQPASHGLEKEHEIIGWLQNRLPVPKIIYFNSYNGFDYMLMTEIDGEILCSDNLISKPEETVKLLADGIKMIKSIPIDDCPFDNRFEVKLKEALYNIENDLVDMSDWEKNNRYNTPQGLLEYLKNNKPKTYTPAFTHGDYCLPNILCKDGKVNGFIDLGRSGIADIYQDIALCVRSLKHNFGTDKYTDLFFEHLEIKPDWERIDYYILLDELF